MPRRIKKITLLHKIHCFFTCILRGLSPIANLCIRLYMANILIRSGFARVDDWQATLFLFEYEYKIPMLPFNVAAILFVMMELVVTPVLALGSL